MDAPRMGDRCREIVTGRTGMLTGFSEYLWGCEQFLMYVEGEKDKDGNPLTVWLDVGRLEVLERGAVEPLVYDRAQESQRVLAYAGQDVEAPTR